VAGIAVLAIALFLLKPWEDDSDEPAASDRTTSEESQADDAEGTTAAAEEDSGDDSEGDSDQDNSDNNNNDNDNDNEQTDEEEQTTAEEPQLVELDDYTGWNVVDAIDELEGQGFDNVTATPTPPDEAEYDTCEVISQNPEGGSEVGYDTPIHFEYVANDDTCPDGNLG
jgi:hypothetical protein